MPAKSEKQRRFMGAELARKRAGESTRTDMTEEELEEFASKSIEKDIAFHNGLTDTNKPSGFVSKVQSDDVKKILVGGKQEGIKPKLPDHLLPRKKGNASEYPPQHGGVLGPHRELKKQHQKFLKFDVSYGPASPAQVTKGEKCDTCLHWKDGAACHLVFGFIHGDDWCNKWEKNDLLQKGLPEKPASAVKALQEKTQKRSKKHPALHSHRDDHPTHLHVQIHKEDGGGDGGGALAGGGTVFTSTNSGVFTPTHGGQGKPEKDKKKKTGIERLGQFIVDNTPEKKMVKSPIESLTDLLHDVRMELRKDDVKRQTPPKSKPTPDDPPQVVEREAEIPDDPNLVAGQKMTEKEQKRIMNEDKNKDSGDPHTLLLDEEDEEEVTKKEWGSGPASVDALRQTGDKDDLESEEDRNEPEQTFLEQIAEAAKKGISKK